MSCPSVNVARHVTNTHFKPSFPDLQGSYNAACDICQARAQTLPAMSLTRVFNPRLWG